jgi:hypothetical protein
MERHPLILKPRTTFKSVVRALPFVVGWLITLFVIGRETGGLVTIVLMIASFISFAAWHAFTDPRYKPQALLMSPCPQCGQCPMRFERIAEGDYVFVCDKCQIEWTLPSSIRHS